WEGLVAGVGAPVCGYVAVRLSERLNRLGGAVAGYRAVRRASLSAARQQRLELVTIVRRLVRPSGESSGPG
ncbi:MAG: hypothetical protein ACRDVW_06045, partial [Acidimicrobiales bacterium]